MNFDLDVEQAMLKKSAREFFTKEVDSALVREIEAGATGHTPRLWNKMARLGWMGLLIPEQYGGEAMSLLDMVVMLEEMGRTGFTGPFFSSAVVATMTLLEGGNEQQKKEMFPQLSNGKKIATVAWHEENTSTSAMGIKTRAVPEKGEYVLTGTKLFVPYAQISDVMVVAARTGNGSPDEGDGISLFIVHNGAPGVDIDPIDTTCGEKQCQLTLDHVRIPGENMLGEINRGWKLLKTVFQKAAIAKCAEMIGGSDRVLRMTVDYAKQRHQFGQAIGSFQAVQHHCANMLMLLELSKATTYRTAWLLSQGKRCDKEMATCKSWVSDAYRSLVALGIQVMGGFGCMEEADHQLFYRRAKAAEMLFGDATYQRELVAGYMGL